MKLISLMVAVLFVAGCATESDRMKLPAPDGVKDNHEDAHHIPGQRAPVSESPASAVAAGPDLNEIQSKLGMKRDSSDLGYAEKSFDGCRYGVKGDNGKCGNRYFGVVNFRLMCRDTEDTTSTVVTNFTPVVTDQVKWKMGGLSGITHTDANGYGQVQLLGEKPHRGQRLVLIVGRQFLGLEVSQISRIVVPVYWCTQLAVDDMSLRPVRFVSDTVEDSVGDTP